MSRQTGRQRSSCRNNITIQAPEPDSPQHELWVRNQESSPLLRLPPELRNRIYAFALTYGQINIQYRPWVHRRRAAAAASSSSSQRHHHSHSHQKDGVARPTTEVVPGGFWTQVYSADADPWSGRHAGKPTTLSLLSGVCRQLYLETALLPFQLNQWSFCSKHVMDRFVLKERRLSLAQRRAIHTLWCPQGQLSKTMERYLGGLRVVIWKRGKHVRREVLAPLKPSDVERRAAAGAGAGRDREWYFYD